MDGVLRSLPGSGAPHPGPKMFHSAPATPRAVPGSAGRRSKPGHLAAPGAGVTGKGRGHASRSGIVTSRQRLLLQSRSSAAGLDAAIASVNGETVASSPRAQRRLRQQQALLRRVAQDYADGSSDVVSQYMAETDEQDIGVFTHDFLERIFGPLDGEGSGETEEASATSATESSTSLAMISEVSESGVGKSEANAAVDMLGGDGVLLRGTGKQLGRARSSRKSISRRQSSRSLLRLAGGSDLAATTAPRKAILDQFQSLDATMRRMQNNVQEYETSLMDMGDFSVFREDSAQEAAIERELMLQDRDRILNAELEAELPMTLERLYRWFASRQEKSMIDVQALEGLEHAAEATATSINQAHTSVGRLLDRVDESKLGLLDRWRVFDTALHQAVEQQRKLLDKVRAQLKDARARRDDNKEAAQDIERLRDALRREELNVATLRAQLSDKAQQLLTLKKEQYLSGRSTVRTDMTADLVKKLANTVGGNEEDGEARLELERLQTERQQQQAMKASLMRKLQERDTQSILVGKMLTNIQRGTSVEEAVSKMAAELSRSGHAAPKWVSVILGKSAMTVRDRRSSAIVSDGASGEGAGAGGRRGSLISMSRPRRSLAGTPDIESEPAPLSLDTDLDIGTDPSVRLMVVEAMEKVDARWRAILARRTAAMEAKLDRIRFGDADGVAEQMRQMTLSHKSELAKMAAEIEHLQQALTASDKGRARMALQMQTHVQASERIAKTKEATQREMRAKRVRRNQAALRIQSTYRGHAARSQVRKMRQLRKYASLGVTEIIELAAYKQKLAAKRAHHNQAAERIQTTWFRYAARQKMRREMEKQVEELPEIRQKKNRRYQAMTMETVREQMRLRQVQRAQQLKRQESAVTIQRVYRGHLVRAGISHVVREPTPKAARVPILMDEEAARAHRQTPEDRKAERRAARRAARRKRDAEKNAIEAEAHAEAAAAALASARAAETEIAEMAATRAAVVMTSIAVGPDVGQAALLRAVAVQCNLERMRGVAEVRQNVMAPHLDPDAPMRGPLDPRLMHRHTDGRVRACLATHTAAVMIQKHWRGAEGRKRALVAQHVRSWRAIKPSQQELATARAKIRRAHVLAQRTKAAGMIQRAWRRCLLQRREALVRQVQQQRERTLALRAQAALRDTHDDQAELQALQKEQALLEREEAAAAVQKTRDHAVPHPQPPKPEANRDVQHVAVQTDAAVLVPVIVTSQPPPWMLSLGDIERAQLSPDSETQALARNQQYQEAATRIQAVWRGHVDRVVLRQCQAEAEAVMAAAMEARRQSQTSARRVRSPLLVYTEDAIAAQDAEAAALIRRDTDIPSGDILEQIKAGDDETGDDDGHGHGHGHDDEDVSLVRVDEGGVELAGADDDAGVMTKKRRQQRPQPSSDQRAALLKHVNSLANVVVPAITSTSSLPSYAPAQIPAAAVDDADQPVPDTSAEQLQQAVQQAVQQTEIADTEAAAAADIGARDAVIGTGNVADLVAVDTAPSRSSRPDCSEVNAAAADAERSRRLYVPRQHPPQRITRPAQVISSSFNARRAEYLRQQRVRKTPSQQHQQQGLQQSQPEQQQLSTPSGTLRPMAGGHGAALSVRLVGQGMMPASESAMAAPSPVSSHPRAAAATRASVSSAAQSHDAPMAVVAGMAAALPVATVASTVPANAVQDPAGPAGVSASGSVPEQSLAQRQKRIRSEYAVATLVAAWRGHVVRKAMSQLRQVHLDLARDAMRPIAASLPSSKHIAPRAAAATVVTGDDSSNGNGGGGGGRSPQLRVIPYERVLAIQETMKQPEYVAAQQIQALWRGHRIRERMYKIQRLNQMLENHAIGRMRVLAHTSKLQRQVMGATGARVVVNQVDNAELQGDGGVAGPAAAVSTRTVPTTFRRMYTSAYNAEEQRVRDAMQGRVALKPRQAPTMTIRSVGAAEARPRQAETFTPSKRSAQWVSRYAETLTRVHQAKLQDQQATVPSPRRRQRTRQNSSGRDDISGGRDDVAAPAIPQGSLAVWAQRHAGRYGRQEDHLAAMRQQEPQDHGKYARLAPRPPMLQPAHRALRPATGSKQAAATTAAERTTQAHPPVQKQRMVGGLPQAVGREVQRVADDAEIDKVDPADTQPPPPPSPQPVVVINDVLPGRKEKPLSTAGRRRARGSKPLASPRAPVPSAAEEVGAALASVPLLASQKQQDGPNGGAARKSSSAHAGAGQDAMRETDLLIHSLLEQRRGSVRRPVMQLLQARQEVQSERHARGQKQQHAAPPTDVASASAAAPHAATVALQARGLGRHVLMATSVSPRVSMTTVGSSSTLASSTAAADPGVVDEDEEAV